MISVQQLSKTYEDPDGRPVPAVTDATLSCHAGEIYGLLGPNGAGKTTTLRCLATLLTPTGGEAILAGRSLLREPEEVRRSIGFMSSTAGLYDRLTPRETLRFFATLHGLEGIALNDRVEETLGLFSIGEYADRPCDRLSTGMKQRVSLARAVVHDPPVLILDEPTSGLDPIVTRSVEEAVVDLARRGKCILFSTHQLEQADSLCSRLGLIVRGRVVAEGTKDELFARSGTDTLKDAFFALVREDPHAPEPDRTDLS